jgi:protein SCO1
MSQQPPSVMETQPEADPPQQARPTISRRTMSWVITGALVVVVVASIFIFNGLANRATQTPSGPSGLLGVDLGNTPAPDMSLKDQNGQVVQLSKLQGKPVVLTFFDSHCPHEECPLTAVGLAQAYKALGKQASQATWVALSVNAADTPASVATFLSHNGVTFDIHYLLGTQDQLSPLWKAYHIVSVPDPQLPGVIDHSTYVYIIDQQGRERVVLDAGPGIDPHQITNDVQYLIQNALTPAIHAYA